MSRTSQSAPKRHQATAPSQMKDGPSRASASTHLSKPHPYGARPSGNALLASPTEARVRPLGLGKLACVHDDVLLEVLLPLLATRELGAMTLASRALYCFGHFPDLWRNLALDACGGGKQSVQFTGGSWKATCAALHAASRDGGTASDKAHARGAAPTHAPLRVSGIYSDALFRPWCCAAAEINPRWVVEEKCDGDTGNCNGNGGDSGSKGSSGGNGDTGASDGGRNGIGPCRLVPRRAYADLGAEGFVAEFEGRNQPVILTGVVTQWPAFRAWQDSAYLAKTCGAAQFRATSLGASRAASFTMKDYHTYQAACHAQASPEESPLYVFERHFADLAPQLARDYTEPRCFTADAPHGSDLFALLGEQARPDHQWLIAGPRLSGSVFHVDPNATHAWNACIKGRKKWVLYPPGCPPPGVSTRGEGDSDVLLPLSLGEWFQSFWTLHEQRRHTGPLEERPVECVVHAGELLFVPHGWWHCVLNLDDSIAITHNYVSSTNLADVLDFLEFKPDQISGIRDRADAVTPELLLPTFCAALQKHMPLLWEKVKAERLARQEATLAAAAAAEQAAAELKARRAAKAMLWGNGNKKGDLTGGNSGSVFAFGF